MTEIPYFSDRILKCMRAPGASESASLLQEGDTFRCAETNEVFPVIDGIPSLFAPSPGEGKDVTEKVRSFYEENPFPSYEGLEEFGKLVSKGHENSFSKNLLDAIGYNKTILECGCGTGQLSHYPQLNNNHVLGSDMSLASLGLAVEHKRRNALNRASFAQMNIFNLSIRDNSFDVVISHGVLHHTYDARRAFSEIVKKLKPGGIIMVGLYNRPARLPTLIRSKLIGLFGPNIDFVVRKRIRDKRKAAIWIADQYYNPHETWHSLDEVLAWFKENHIDYLNASPAILGTDGEESSGLFDATSPGTRYQRCVTQLAWLGTIAREGALFDVIGKKALPHV